MAFATKAKSAAADEPSAKKPRARAKKAVSIEAETEKVEEPPTPKKRGRPKKVVQEEPE